ncbi:MAG: tail fiber domain-containing protein [Planctomycetes bacterium]|nr:tail fiber domain-containing protein [Planctomycetota bacterium]
MEARRLRMVALAATLVLGVTGVSWGDAVGTAFTYQGQLKEGGSPANGTYDFRFALYDDPDFGSQVNGIVDVADKQVSNGLFTVQLDFGDVYNGTALWLWVLVRPGDSTGAYTQLWPRQPLTATPYALYALQAPGSGGDGNTLDQAYDEGGAGAGRTITADAGPVEILGPDGLIVAGAIQCGTSVTIDGTANTISADADLEFHVASGRGLRIETNATSPNIVGGHAANAVSGGAVGATISGGGAAGFGNEVTASHGTVCGGRNNAAGSFGTVAGGIANSASGERSFVGGGTSNQATGYGATVSGGDDNVASGQYATVCGGDGNTASAQGSMALGGVDCLASGLRSLAAGSYAQAEHEGSFVWGDRYGAVVASTAANKWTVRSRGGVRFYTNSDLTAGVQLPAGGSAWQSVSDRNAKENFEPVDTKWILEQLAAVSIETWNYKTQVDAIRHIGPMAQDFYAAFGVGEDDKHITTIDTDGVALAAIQGLHQILQEKDGQIAAQGREIAAQRKQIADLSVRLERMEAIMGELAKVETGGAR